LLLAVFSIKRRFSGYSRAFGRSRNPSSHRAQAILDSRRGAECAEKDFKIVFASAASATVREYRSGRLNP
jgi:hypothetical protein